MADFLAVCEEAARAGGATLLSWIGQFTVNEKGPSDLVTQADLAAQKAVFDVIRGHFPEHGLVGEEGSEHQMFEREYCWIVDPLDGTTNYVHQVPHYCCSVALEHRGRVIAGVVFDPVSKECFASKLGGGAFLNGRAIRVSRVTQLSQALAAASFSAKVERSSSEINQFVEALLACQSVRRTGSAALNLCYVAAGRFDAFWAMSTKAWDVAAGVLLVQEAGGVVTDIEGQTFDLRIPHPIASSTPELHAQFLKLMQVRG